MTASDLTIVQLSCDALGCLATFSCASANVSECRSLASEVGWRVISNGQPEDRCPRHHRHRP